MTKRLKIFALLICCLLGNISIAQEAPRWMRYPAISPDGTRIVFTYKGDLYLVASSGGVARQLTFHEAHDYQAVWSHDGKTIAFASDRYGNFDIFTMSPEGGPATRLTFHSNDELPFEFSADDQSILFGTQRMDMAEHRQYPSGSQPELYSVPRKGGRVDQILTVPAEYTKVSKDGSKMIYHDKKGGENEWRKHHQSGIARDIWLYDTKANTHKMLTTFYGEDRNPVFSPDESEIYYLSEANGSFNIFAMNAADPSQTEALTTLENFPVRFLSISSDGLMSFGYDGELYTLRKGQAPKKLAITLQTQAITNSDNYISINGGVREMSISPDGKEIAFVARGEVFVTSVDGSFTKRITNTPEQERFVEFAPDGKSLVYASEREGKWQIFQSTKVRSEEPFFFASTLLEEKPLVKSEGEAYLPKFSPDGKKLAYVEDRRTLKVLDLASQETVTLMTPDELFHMRDGDQYFTWAPDSKWLLATYRPTMANSEVVLLDASGKQKMKNLTKSGYGDDNAMWVNDGKQMLWFSNRDGLRSYATSGQSQNDVYTLFFDKTAWEKFTLSKEDFDLMKEIEKANKKEEKDDKSKEDKEKDKEKDKKVGDLKFEWDGIEDRKAKLTIHSSSLGDAVLSKDGDKLYYLAAFEKGMNLWSTDLRTKETKQELSLDANYANLTWDKDQKFLYLLSNGSISKINPEGMKKEAIKISGEMTYDKEAEMAYMFEHVWLRTKGIFYTPDMHGVDWDSAKVDYQKYLPSIGNSYEFSEMISEMIGELNVSHAGARYSRSVDMADATASLGVFWDYKHTGDGIKITEVIAGGPLDKTGLDIKKGMVIEKIDGQTLTAESDIAKFLNRKADTFTLLELVNPESKERKQVTVKPISLRTENQLLYKRWVKMNQAEVDSLSDGKLGYVHIPGMSDEPYRNVYEEMMGKYHDSEAVIVDTRFNGGGDLVADLAMFFTGEKFLTYATEAREVGYEPTARWTKPTLAMFNEANYSDGHCFACGYTDLKIGKTVGMPTPGTCSFAGWEALPDGSRWGAVPISAKNKAGEWLENNETKPQFEVKNMPGKIDQGQDQQLQKAVEELLKEVN
ncbi:Tol biopolymer transport system component/C-terminal processing protease CtpA/Prc [Algoriphagus sp. 4150]|uniref:S41 family peptidase n=1 Tax=Algoriphagus sp. 4150 TaxID=2817756 RepID=UPI00285CBA32|nr:S41 family peptidase [Algoriphagus sp. 4150]MDR7128230.1 Tol biopolymer transport system component/C-terminal processing protease CtpA/Prc [Algoriphagus sp. 4150]